jgi:glycosyltransferase involved in cell wall biosynthesis
MKDLVTAIVGKLVVSTPKTVSVVLPFYNARATLRKAVFSVLTQSYHDWRLILLDDGSLDGSVGSVADLVDNERIFLVSDGENRGLIYRLNQMVEIANTPFIARMDADDLMHPERLQKQMEAFAANSRLDIVSSGMAIINKNYEVMGLRSVSGQPDLVDILKHGGLVHASCIFRREFLVRHRYNSDFVRAEDRELFLRVSPDVRYHCVSEPLYICMEYDCFSKKKYLDSYRSERKAILLHGPRLCGRLATIVFYLRSMLKSFVVHLFSAVGAGQRLSRRSSVSRENDGLGALQSVVDRVLVLSKGSS